MLTSCAILWMLDVNFSDPVHTFNTPLYLGTAVPLAKYYYWMLICGFFLLQDQSQLCTHHCGAD